MAILAAVVVLEGVRRVPAGAVLARRFVFGDWRVWGSKTVDPRYQLLSWCPPFVTTIVLASASANPTSDPNEVRVRLEAIRSQVSQLRLAGGAVLVALVLGVPAAVGWFGGGGFLMALYILLVLSASTAAIGFVGMRRISKSDKAALRWALPLVSPFAAPRAAEALMEEAARGMSPALIVQRLLPPVEFLRWLRPHAYDLLHGHATAESGLLGGLRPTVLEEALARTEPLEPGTTRCCDRCGLSFTFGDACPDCGVPLLPVGAQAASSNPRLSR